MNPIDSMLAELMSATNAAGVRLALSPNDPEALAGMAKILTDTLTVFALATPVTEGEKEVVERMSAHIKELKRQIDERYQAVKPILH